MTLSYQYLEVSRCNILKTANLSYRVCFSLLHQSLPLSALSRESFCLASPLTHTRTADCAPFDRLDALVLRAWAPYAAVGVAHTVVLEREISHRARLAGSFQRVDAALAGIMRPQ